MRYYMIIPALALVLGCKKSSTSSTASTAPTFQFNVNGTVYQMNGNGATTNLGAKFDQAIGVGCTGNADTLYWLEATDSEGDGCTIGTTLVSSLSVMTYTNSYSFQAGPNGNCTEDPVDVKVLSYSSTWFTIEKSGDYTTIVVTSIHDGLADGTFSGQLSPNDPIVPPASMTITNGQFKNIPIVN